MHGFERGGDLFGIMGEIINDRNLVRGADDLQTPANAGECFEVLRRVFEIHAACGRRGERRKRVGHIVHSRHVELDSDDLAGGPRLHRKRDCAARTDRQPGKQVRFRVAQAPGYRPSWFQIGQQRRGLRVIEVEHRRLTLAGKVAEENTQFLDRLMIEGDVVHHRDARCKIRDRTVALVDFADEFLPVTDPGGGERGIR